MSPTRQTLLLAKRELLQRVQTKAFAVTMALLVGMVLISGPLISAATGDDDPIVVGVVGDVPADFEADLEFAATAFEAKVTVERFDELDPAEHAVEEGEADVVLVDGRELVFHTERRFFTSQIIQAALTSGERRSVLSDLEASPEQRTRLAGVELTYRTIVEENVDDEARQVAAFLALITLYIAILVFGQFVAMGTVQEKQNRVVEVVLSKVTATQVLVSKVMGIGLLGLGQLIVLGLAGLVTVSIVDTDLSLPALGLSAIWGALLWFILGYTLYAFVYATLGATVSRQEDLQGVLVIPLVLLLPGYIIAQIATAAPTTALARFGSLVPFWSPMIMPSRMATGHATALEVIIAIALVLATIYALVRLGSRVYEGALLRTGGRIKLSEAWRAARD